MGDVYQQVPVSSAFGSDSPLQAAMQLSKNTNDMLNVLLSLNKEDSGSFITYSGERLPW